MILECYNVLKQIQPRPAMFTGEETLRSVHIYLSGYYHALVDNKLVNKPHTDEPFFNWISNKLGYYESTAGWVNMILANSMGFKPHEIEWSDFSVIHVSKEQHSKSIDYFYKLVEEYKNEIEL